MDSGDLQIVRCFFQDCGKSSAMYKTEIDNVLAAIDALSAKLIGAEPSITIPRKDHQQCGVCNKRVIVNE